MFLNRAEQLCDEIVAMVRKEVRARCETCLFWRGGAAWNTPKGWKRCKLTETDTSPLHSCKDWEQ